MRGCAWEVRGHRRGAGADGALLRSAKLPSDSVRVCVCMCRCRWTGARQCRWRVEAPRATPPHLVVCHATPTHAIRRTPPITIDLPIMLTAFSRACPTDAATGERSPHGRCVPSARGASTAHAHVPGDPTGVGGASPLHVAALGVASPYVATSSFARCSGLSSFSEKLSFTRPLFRLLWKSCR